MDDVAEAHALALQMHQLHGIAAELAAAEEAYEAARKIADEAEATRKKLYNNVTHIREKRKLGLVDCAANGAAAVDLAKLTKQDLSLVSRTVKYVKRLPGERPDDHRS
jgi:hypothetical protein